MISEIYVQKLIRLINQGVIMVEQIIDPAYKAEVENRLMS